MKTLGIGKIILVGLILGMLTPLFALSAPPETKDSDITAAIQKRLLADWWVRSKVIDVETKGGIVKLSGTVDNILANERSVEIAKSTRGVRAVIDMINVDVIDKEDKEIHREIVKALEQDPAVEHQDIDVQVMDGFVIISGTVDSYTEKHRAWRVTKGVKGVTGVRNNVYVERKPERPDDEIKADIEGRFKDSAVIDYNLIKVSVKNGNVKLSGSAGSESEKLRAKWRAEAVLNVKSVDDSALVVKAVQGDLRRASYEVSRSEEATKKAIRDALIYDPRVDSSRISIEVVIPKAAVDVPRTANVTLSGTVGRLAAKWAAEEDATNTIGVAIVRNQLIVSEENATSDSELINNVEKVLLADPQLGNFRIRLSVLNGSIRLMGVVGSNSDKQRAEDIVSGVEGVVNVQNDLSVE